MNMPPHVYSSLCVCDLKKKMNILPRIDFVSSRPPLSPPSDYCIKVQSAVATFIWKGRRPRLKIEGERKMAASLSLTTNFFLVICP